MHMQVHAYISGSIGKTAYLSELVSGSEVTVVDPSGHTRQALVGRCKIEKRPMVSAPASAPQRGPRSTPP